MTFKDSSRSVVRNTANGLVASLPTNGRRLAMSPNGQRLRGRVWSYGPSPDTRSLCTPIRRTRSSFLAARASGSSGPMGHRNWSEGNPATCFRPKRKSIAWRSLREACTEIETEIKGGVPPRFAPSTMDVTEITPELAQVVYENPRVRVLHLRGEPGSNLG